MAGGNKDSDMLVVCASRQRVKLENKHALHGVCYSIENKNGDVPMDPKPIKPLIQKGKIF